MVPAVLFCTCQNLFQSNRGGSSIIIIFAPVTFFRDLCIQRWKILPDIEAFGFSNFFYYIGLFGRSRIANHIKLNSVPLLFCFCQDLILVTFRLSESNVVFCQPPQHIFALPYVYNYPIDCNLIYTSVLEARSKPSAL